MLNWQNDLGFHDLAVSAPATPMEHGLRTILRSKLARIYEYRCDGHPIDPAPEVTRRAEVVLVQSGAFIRHDDEAHSFMDESIVGLFAAGGPYRISHLGSRPDVSTIIVPPDASELMPGVTRNRPMLLRADARTHLLHELLLQALRQCPSDAVVAEHLAKALLDHVGELAVQSRSARIEVADNGWRFSDDVLFAVLDYLYAHRHRAIGLDELAQHSGYSIFHLTRIFRARMGCTLKQHLLHFKLKAALHQIVHSQQSITQLAIEAGFASGAHLSDRFRQWMGMSPSMVRNLSASAKGA